MSTTRTTDLKPKDSVTNVLDQAILTKLKQHNRSFYHQKKEDAMALRSKLEQWREEKKKKKVEEQKKVVRPFVTTVLKPVSSQVKEKAVPGKEKRLTMTTTAVPGKPATGVGKNPSKPAGVGLANKFVKRDQKASVRASHVLKGKTKVEKENMKTSVPAQKSRRLTEKVSDCSRLSAAEMTTPLSAKPDAGIHTVVTTLTDRAGDQQAAPPPASLADELQSAFTAMKEVAIDSLTKPLKATQKKSSDLGRNLIGSRHPAVKSNKALPGKPGSASITVSEPVKFKSPRNSLTAQYRKVKSSSTKKQAPASGQPFQRTSTAKKGSTSPSAYFLKRPQSKPPKSILKGKPCTTVSMQFASPVLPARATQSERETQGVAGSTKQELAASGASSHKKTATTEHVTFTSGMKSTDGGAHFRKTPGQSKTHEYMRLKLNEWLEAKGRTPSGMRHAGCFGCSLPSSSHQTSRSQIKASLSAKQLSRQENALAREDIGASPRLAKRATKSFSCSTPHHPASTRRSHRLSQSAFNSNGKSTVFTDTEKEKGQERGDTDSQAEENGMIGNEMNTEELDTGNVAADQPEEQSVLLSPLKDADGVESSMAQLEKDFQTCLTSLESGELHAPQAVEWLAQVGEVSMEVRRHVNWYRCRVAALKKLEDQDALLSVFEEAIINNAQPVEEMAQLLTGTMKELLLEESTKVKRSHKSASCLRPVSAGCKRSQRFFPHADHLPEVQQENVFKSTSVKYSVTEVTPFKKRRTATISEEGDLISVITPVRRSARLSCTKAAPTSEGRPLQQTPSALLEYGSLREVPSEEKERMLFRPNRALEPFLSDDSQTGDESLVDSQEAKLVTT